jgi:hypothetical protein
MKKSRVRVLAGPFAVLAVTTKSARLIAAAVVMWK